MKRPPFSTLLQLGKTNPLIKQLNETFVGKRSRRLRRKATEDHFDPLSKLRTDVWDLEKIHWQNEIVSEKLCDDLIQYLAPVLEQHKGATLIDVNPGACLWSSKIHDFLQPRCHLLMEPNEKYYEPFIKPLLERPGSKYTYTTLKGAHAEQYWSNYQAVFDNPELLPHRPILSPGDPKLRQLDPSMLVIGNLWRTDEASASRSRKGVNMAPLILNHMLYGALANDIFHRSGLVRMLWWMPEAQLLEIQSPNTYRKRSLATQMGAGSEIVHLAGNRSLEDLIVATTKETSRYQAVPPAMSQVAWTNRQNLTLSPPVDRELLTEPEEASEIEIFEDHNPLITTCSSFDDLDHLVEDFKVRFAKVPVDPYGYNIKGQRRKMMSEKGFSYPVVYPQSHVLYKREAIPYWERRHYMNEAVRTRCTTLLDLSLQVVHLEAELSALKERYPDDRRAEDAKTTVLQLGTEVDQLIEPLYAPLAFRLDILVEQFVAMYASPRPNQRDRRPFEPLKAGEFDFWPEPGMALIMMTPTPHDFTIPDEVNSKEAAQLFKQVVKAMQEHAAAASVSNQLNHLAPNAARYLISQVPSVTDVRKGGRLNVDKVKGRSLSPEILAELTKAYVEWPFRPSNIELLLESDEARRAVQSSDGTTEDMEQEALA